MEKFTGKVWVLDDDIDTDIIIPTEYLALKTIDDMCHCQILCKNLFQKFHQ